MKKLIHNLDESSFHQFIVELWKRENVNSDKKVISLKRLNGFNHQVYEQSVCSFDGPNKFQGFNSIFPFNEPFDLIRELKIGKLKTNEDLLSDLIRYKRRWSNKIAKWNIFTQGEIYLPIIAFVSNLAGFEEEFYQDFVLPELEDLMQAIKMPGVAKIGTCDSFIDLDFENVKYVFEKVISKAKGLVISFDDGQVNCKEFQSERYLKGGVLKGSLAPITTAAVFTDTISEIKDEFQRLLVSSSKEKELERFVKKYYRHLFGMEYDRIETQVWLKCSNIDYLGKDRRLDVFLRNSASSNWDVLELKHLLKPIRLNRSNAYLASEICRGISQLKNYQSLLSQKSVQEQLKRIGIDAFEPQLKLVITKAPQEHISVWDKLKRQYANDIKIIAIEELVNEVTIRCNNQLDWLSKYL